ncbi:MAG: flagellar filament capping protein FliD [Oscillospiraceae bacterium]|nr:flagellar filament capping protein FliD [Oscillospiraceae bacterium]
MASISSISGSSGTSSLYNSANIISGLASGMDTEGMIESLVQSYQNKIQTLNNKATKIQWKQESYRSIISKMAAFSSKYTSYTSSTNLLSSSFFSSAVKVAALGKFGDKVTASGRTDSDVVLKSVSQLATAARYVTNGSGLKGDTGNNVTASDELDLNSDVTLGTLSGSLGFSYGSKSVSISFDEVADRIGVDEDGNKVELTTQEKTQKLADLIKEKLGNEKITLSTGESVSAADRIDVVVDGGTIRFADKSGAGNSVSITSASDSVKKALGIGDTSDSDNPVKSISVNSNTQFTKDVKAYNYLSGKSININVDGVTKSIQMPKIEKITGEDGSESFKLTMPSTVKDKYGNTSYVYDTSKLDKDKYTITKQGDTTTVDSVDGIAGAYTDMLQKSVKSAFGDKLKVSNTATEDGKLKLDFEVKEGSNLLINTSVGETLGIGRTATNYLNTSSTLKDLMKEDVLNGLEVAKDADGWPMKDDKTGKPLYDFKINDVLIGRYTEDATLSEIMSDINSNSEAGVKVSYSKATREFVFNSKETGSSSEIDIKDGLAAAIFGSTEISEQSTGTFAENYGIDWLGEGQTEDVKFDFGNRLYGTTISADDTIEDVAEKLNQSIANEGWTAAYNKYTGELEVTDKSGAKVDFSMYLPASEGNPPYSLKFDDKYAPKVEYTAGQDAKFTVKVNGTEKTLTRGSNSVEIDGLTINFKETFKETDEGYEEISFKTSTDSDKIVDAVKSMISDYNDMMTEIRSAYATMPYQNSSGAFQTYEPLTEEQKTGMSESEIKNYEERAKQGILFGDTTLRNLYERMQSVFQPGGADGALLQKIGISTSFSTDNVTTITLDENKLREALDNDPDAVADLFTRTGESGASNNGIMQGLKTQLDRYAGLTGATKGILIQQAGTPLNSLSLLDNQWQKEIDSLGTQIEKWQDKLESQVDRYTSMFSRLEVLINQMNSQSSTLAGLMGG